MSKTCFAYVRVSTEEQKEGASLDEQKLQIKLYASRRGIRIIEWFEESESAAKKGRPKFDELLKRLGKKEADGVIIHKIDRSARNFHDWARIADHLDAGVEFHYAVEGLDLSTRGGRLSADLIATISTDYIRNLKQEMRKGFYGRLNQGLYPLRAPIGYLNNGKGKRKTIDPAYAPQIKHAFKLYATGEYSLHSLRSEMQLTNCNGGPVSIKGWSTILRNPFYYGVMRLRSTGETFQGNHEPIIDQKLFDRVQAVLDGKSGKKLTKHRLRYASLFRCSACNKAVIGERQKGSVYYRCHTSGCVTKGLKEDEIDAAAYGFLQSCTLLPTIAPLVERELEKITGEQEQIVTSKRRSYFLQRDNIQVKLERLSHIYLEGVIEQDEYAKKLTDLNLSKENIERKIEGLVNANGSEQQILADSVELAKTLISEYKMGDDDRKRRILKIVASNFSVHGKNIYFRPRNLWRGIQKQQAISLCAGHRRVDRTFSDAEVASEIIKLMLNDEIGSD